MMICCVILGVAWAMVGLKVNISVKCFCSYLYVVAFVSDSIIYQNKCYLTSKKVMN